MELLAASTLGVLYIVEKGRRDRGGCQVLAGKTIYATGRRHSSALTYLLAQNGLALGRRRHEWSGRGEAPEM